jgi:hypothetical protein
MFQPGYSKIKAKDGGKFYGPKISFLGSSRHLKRAQKTASEALAYAYRFCARYERLKNAEKKVSGDQG